MRKSDWLDFEDYFWVEVDPYGSESSTGFSNTKSFIPFPSFKEAQKYVNKYEPDNISIEMVTPERVLRYHDLDDESLKQRILDEEAEYNVEVNQTDAWEMFEEKRDSLMRDLQYNYQKLWEQGLV